MNMIRILTLLALAAMPAASWAQITVETCGAVADGFGSSMSISVPTHNDGEELFLYAKDGDREVTLQIQEGGWDNRVQLSTGGVGGDRQLAAWTRTASSEPASYTIENANQTNSAFSAQMCVLSGVHADTIDTSCTEAVFNNDGSPQPPSITTVTDAALVWTIIGGNGHDMTAFSVPSGYTEHAAFADGTGDVFGGASLEKATAGSEQPGDWTGLQINTDTSLATCAFKPADTTSGLLLRRRRS